MNGLDDGAIEVAKQTFAPMGKWTVSQQRRAGFFARFFEEFIAFANHAKKACVEQIQTFAQIDDRADHIRLADARLLPGVSPTFFGREFHGPIGVAFPEVDAGAKPIVFVMAWFELLAPRENGFPDLPIAAVITQDE